MGGACADYLGHISIHALREEGDLGVCPQGAGRSDFYPRPPRGGRHASHPYAARHCAISIHALREEGDLTAEVARAQEAEFLSTPSARRATACISTRTITNLFLSTPSARRATREGKSMGGQSKYFYPRPPRGGRQEHRHLQCAGD